MESGIPSLFRSFLGSHSSSVMALQRVVPLLYWIISSEVGSTLRANDSLLKTSAKLLSSLPSSSTWNYFSSLVIARNCTSNSRTTLERRSRDCAESKLRSAGLERRRQSSKLFTIETDDADWRFDTDFCGTDRMTFCYHCYL